MTEARDLQGIESTVETTVIIPAYNEEEGLAIVLEKLLAVVDGRYELLVVDDGSSDQTAEVARRYPVTLVCHETNRGKAAAMRTGIEAARGESIIFIDADDTYPAESLPVLAAALRTHDMAVGSRAGGQANIPAFNRIGNAIFRNSIRLIYGYRPYDPLTGFYGLHKRHLQRMDLRSDGFRIETEIAIKAARMGLSTFDLPIEYRERVGQAKLRGLQDGYAIGQTILTMAPLYNPTLTFLLPGLLSWALGMTGLFATLDGSALTGFVLSALFVVVGYGTTLLGIALDLHAVAHRHTLPNRFTRRALRSRFPWLLAANGFVLLAIALWVVRAQVLPDVDESKRQIFVAMLGTLSVQSLLGAPFFAKVGHAAHEAFARR